MDEEQGFERDVQMNPLELDKEVCLQAELFYKWTMKLAEAREALDNAELALAQVYAKLDAQARTDPGAFGITKATETAISNAIKLRPEYENAENEVIKARANLNMMDNRRKAMEQKKSMLELQVKLHGQQYFSVPSVRDISLTAQDIQARRRGQKRSPRPEEPKEQESVKEDEPDKPRKRRRRRA